MRKEQRQRRFVVLPFLREAVRQPSHPLGEAANRAVHAFAERRAGLIALWVAYHGALLDAYYLRRRILALCVWANVAEMLNHLSIVDHAEKIPRENFSRSALAEQHRGSPKRAQRNLCR